MSFDRPRHGTVPTDQPIPSSQRRTFLDVLRMELEQVYGLGSGVVMRDRRLVLFVVVLKPRTRSAEIGCDMHEDGWWFTWVADDDRTIAPVEDTSGTAAAIAGELGVCSKNRRNANRS